MARDDEVVGQAAMHVRGVFEGESSGHDWWHVYRVWQSTLRIGQEEGADLFVVQLAALLHDIADWKFHGGDDAAGPTATREWLETVNVAEEVVDHVCSIVRDISFKGSGVATPMATLEGKVVQDADRLDAIGAVGVARAFAFGGHAGRAMHEPNLLPEAHQTFEEYKRATGATINHFYEKLLLLRDRMNTPTGRRLAEGRHAYMEGFLDRFFLEWEGRA